MSVLVFIPYHIVEADMQVVSDSSSDEEGEESRAQALNEIQQQQAINGNGVEPRVAAADDEMARTSQQDSFGFSRTGAMAQDIGEQGGAGGPAGAAFDVNAGNPNFDVLQMQQQQLSPPTGQPVLGAGGQQSPLSSGGNASAQNSPAGATRDHAGLNAEQSAQAQHQAALEDMQKCLETMRTTAPAPNTTVLRNGKVIPILHAARPIHMPPERFGSSISMRKDFVMQPLPFADRLRTLQVISQTDNLFDIKNIK